MKDDLEERVAELEADDVFNLIFYTGDPDGVVNSVAGTFSMDLTAQNMYVCFGATVWKRVGQT